VKPTLSDKTLKKYEEYKLRTWIEGVKTRRALIQSALKHRKHAPDGS